MTSPLSPPLTSHAASASASTFALASAAASADHSAPTSLSAVPSADDDRYHAVSTESAIAAESQLAAHNYAPLPVVLSRASGVHVWDPEGRHYLDFLSAYSALNQGHCHPALVKVFTDQAARLCLISRAFHNDVFPRWAAKVCDVFGYDMVLPMNTGAEAVESAVKIARKWAYRVKGVQPGTAIILSVMGNFHGRTITAVSLSTDPESRDGYGPYLPNVGAQCPAHCYDPDNPDCRSIRYNSIPDVARALLTHGPSTAAIIVEPIQGEAGVIVPADDYLTKLHELCRQHQVLLIADEVQTGIARTGRMLCSQWSAVRPDMVCLGKALSGGMYPVSCVLADHPIMSVLDPGTHGSTFAGNPLGCAVSIRALDLVIEEDLAGRADRLGNLFRHAVSALASPIVCEVRGKGLLNAVVIDETAAGGRTAGDLCLLMKNKGLLAKPTHGNIIRFAPPLIITEAELNEGIAILADALRELPTVTKSFH